ncbi:MAG: hypothetical protein FJX51_03885 [Alphaproteobacteria bacterium]|nr:hypothetical protein [Alphaproteobacteria bacterium]
MGNSKRALSVAGALLVLALAGACGGRGVWTKEGATTAERTAIQKSCAAESGDYGFLNNEGMSSTGRYATGNTSDVYRLCMFSRGYGQIPAAEQKKQQTPTP